MKSQIDNIENFRHVQNKILKSMGRKTVEEDGISRRAYTRQHMLLRQEWDRRSQKARLEGFYSSRLVQRWCDVIVVS